ncbi:MAG: M domain protein [Desulfosporosinus sp.]|nr:M domain protein [Desulfosporosinus sp.]
MEKEIKEVLGLILNKLDGLESRMERFESQMDRFGSRMDRLESRQEEIYMVVKAIEHNNEVHGAEIDQIKFKLHYIEGTFKAIGDVITTGRR